MPWPKRQKGAIARRLEREGKSEEEISAFFRSHGHGGLAKKLAKKKRKG